MRHSLAALAIGASLALGACSKSPENQAGGAAASTDAATGNLPAAVAGAQGMSTVSKALTSTGLAGIFDGRGSYTLIAPTDAAFAKLGEPGAALLEPEQKPALAAALRDHIVPGVLTTTDIAKAIDLSSNKAVKMRTMGSGELTFRKVEGGVQVTAADGSTAMLAGPELRGQGSLAIPADAVLRKL